MVPEGYHQASIYIQVTHVCSYYLYMQPLMSSGKLYEYNALHSLCCDLVNALTKYLWFYFLVIITLAAPFSKVHPETYLRRRGINTNILNSSEFFFQVFFSTMPQKSRNSTEHYVVTIKVLLYYSFKIMYTCLQCSHLNKTYLISPQSKKCVECV